MERDIDLINHIKGTGGATIEQITALFFPSYVRASIRLKQLKDYGYLKSEQHEIGKIVYYTDKLPSTHNLYINEILIALRGKYKAFKRNANLEHCQVDLAIRLKNGKMVIFEIERFNRVTKEKQTKIKQDVAEPYDLWIVTARQSDGGKGRINYNDIKKVSNYYK